MHNGELYLAEALSALAGQTYPHLEVVICDNASTDATAQICETFQHDPRFRYVRSEANCGAAENFNRAFRRSSGELFCWTAHDDRMHPEFIRRCFQQLSQNTDAAMCVTSVRFINGSGEAVGVVHERPDLSSTDLRTRLRSYLRRPAWFLVYGLARRSILEQTALFPSCYGPDVILLWQVLLQHRFCVISEPLLEYRRLPEGGRRAESRAAAMSPAAGTSWHRYGSWRMWNRMWQATSAARLSGRDRWVARKELLSWLFTRYWRRLLFNDCYSELRIALAQGRQVRRVVALAFMIVLRPVHCWRNLSKGRAVLRPNEKARRRSPEE